MDVTYLTRACPARPHEFPIEESCVSAFSSTVCDRHHCSPILALLPRLGTASRAASPTKSMRPDQTPHRRRGLRNGLQLGGGSSKKRHTGRIRPTFSNCQLRSPENLPTAGDGKLKESLSCQRRCGDLLCHSWHLGVLESGAQSSCLIPRHLDRALREQLPADVNGNITYLGQAAQMPV